MRISNNMLIYNFMNSLNGSLARQNTLQEQLSDGKVLHKPSDDPVKTVRALRFHTNLALNDQYTQDVKDAQSWMNTTDSAMSNLSSIMQRAKELVIEAGGPNPTMANEAIGKEIDGLIDAAVDIGNMKIGDRYIFAGQQDKTEPFKRYQLPGNPPTDVVTYNGDSNKILMRIQSGVQDAAQDSVSLTGQDVFGAASSLEINGQKFQTLDIFKDLISIKNELLQGGTIQQSNNQGAVPTVTGAFTTTPPDTSTYKDFIVKIGSTGAGGAVNDINYSMDGGKTFTNVAGPGPFTLSNGAQIDIPASGNNKSGDTYSFHFPLTSGSANVNWLSNTGLRLIDNAHDYMLKSQTQLGTRASMYKMSQSFLEDNDTIINSDIAENEDLDIPKAIMDFQNSQNVYRMALSVGARVMPASLADFLK